MTNFFFWVGGDTCDSDGGDAATELSFCCSGKFLEPNFLYAANEFPVNDILLLDSGDGDAEDGGIEGDVVKVLYEFVFTRGMFLKRFVSRLTGLAGDSLFGPSIADVGVSERNVVVNFDEGDCCFCC